MKKKFYHVKSILRIFIFTKINKYTYEHYRNVPVFSSWPNYNIFVDWLVAANVLIINNHDKIRLDKIIDYYNYNLDIKQINST